MRYSGDLQSRGTNRIIEGARDYERAADLGIVTSYFNPSGYRRKLDNYHAFIERIRRSGIVHRTVECAFEDAPFALERSNDVIQVRSPTVMFQKEHLLNLAIEALPKHCTKVAWLDCDIIFENPRWAVETSEVLDRHPIMQPYVRGIRLPRDRTIHRGDGRTWLSFAATACLDPSEGRSPMFDRHGHTGFAWAARRDLLARHGLYAGAVDGSSDHLMAHAIFGDWSARCSRRMLGVSSRAAEHFRTWARAFFGDVGGSIGYVEGAVLHLWHGEIAERRYAQRAKELKSLGFDPAVDIRRTDAGPLEWATDKPDLHRWAIDFFDARNEDGIISGSRNERARPERSSRTPAVAPRPMPSSGLPD